MIHRKDKVISKVYLGNYTMHFFISESKKQKLQHLTKHCKEPVEDLDPCLSEEHLGGV